MTLWPNPVLPGNSDLSVSVSGLKPGLMTLSAADVLGSRVWAETYSTNARNFDAKIRIDTFPPGLYFIICQQGSNTIVSHVLVF